MRLQRDGCPRPSGAIACCAWSAKEAWGPSTKRNRTIPAAIVALKVIKPGLTSPELLRRFERESQALGRLQHPGIAQIYEVGTADAGFGPACRTSRWSSSVARPLRDYAAVASCSTRRERLELVARVCDAVEHAHQRGIIHRDLKPGNILVDELGATEDSRLRRGTGHRQRRRTSRSRPIWAAGRHAGLHEPRAGAGGSARTGYAQRCLCAGRDPVRTAGRAVAVSIEQQAASKPCSTIRDEDPARLSSISRTYRGDVETIVAKALEKDKARRYASAAALAEDIRRYLADEPIAARSATATYQLQKFARRHKALVGGTAVVFVAARRRDRRQHPGRPGARARRNSRRRPSATSCGATSLAQASARAQSSPDIKPDPDLKVRTALDRAAARIGDSFRRPAARRSVDSPDDRQRLSGSRAVSAGARATRARLRPAQVGRRRERPVDDGSARQAGGAVRAGGQVSAGGIRLQHDAAAPARPARRRACRRAGGDVRPRAALSISRPLQAGRRAHRTGAGDRTPRAGPRASRTR